MNSEPNRVLDEAERPTDNQELYEQRQIEVKRLGHTGLTGMVISEAHPHFADWKYYVWNMPHQGC